MLLPLLAIVSAAAQPTCLATDDAPVLRQRAAELYTLAEHEAADACVSLALKKVTADLEVLAAQAEALRRFREARRAASATPPSQSGCMIDAHGASVCLPELKSPAADLAPKSAEECGSEEAALALLRKHEESDPAASALTTTATNSALDLYIIQTTQRHWWSAAKRAVDILRSQNIPAGSDARKAVTVLRDEAGSLLALMRQTRMDEATISCAVMWAQVCGEGAQESCHTRLPCTHPTHAPHAPPSRLHDHRGAMIYAG